MDHYLVDGYNVIHSIPALKKMLAHDPYAARETFIQYVSTLTHKRTFRCTLVFDGDQQPDAPKKTLHAPVHVVFSFPVSADDKIREIISNSSKRNELVVITSDKAILDFARVCSCRTHTSRHFANLILSNEEITTEKEELPLSKSQIDEWLRIFGEK
jgi:predicted RNA-binding protein with PIN domain